MTEQALPDEEPEELEEPVAAEQAVPDLELEEPEAAKPAVPDEELEEPVEPELAEQPSSEIEMEPDRSPGFDPDEDDQERVESEAEKSGLKQTLIELPVFEPTSKLSDIEDAEFEPEIPEIDDDEFGIDLSEPEPDPDPDPLIGQVLFNEYVVDDLVGSGPALITYRARQQTRDGFVALKTTRQKIPAITSEFVEAATNHLSLDHKNIAASLGLYQTEPDCPFYASEWLDGISLLAISRETGALTDEEELSQIVFEICDALEYAHARGVTHGELAASNIIMCLIDDDLHAKLTDFGFCRVQEKLQALQDPSADERDATDSPLWLEDQKKNDILMLGNLILGLITGTEVRPGSTEPRARLSEACPDLMATGVLDAVLDEALEPDPDWRFNSIGEFREAFRNWLAAAREERETADSRQMEPSVPADQDLPEADTSAPQPVAPLEVASPVVDSEDLAMLTGRSGLSGVLPVQSETGGPPPKRRTREVRKTLVKMTALKERQVEDDDRLTTQIFQVISKEQARVSPARAVAVLTGKIIAAVSVLILAFTYLVLNWNGVVEAWRNTSLKLSEAMRHRDGGEVQPAEVEDLAPELATEAQTTAEPGQKGTGPAGATTASGAAAPPVRRAHPKFSYKESPTYRHWVIHEVGTKRRIEPDQ